MIKISIITINYNNLKGLKKTVNSVKNQSWQEFEYIVIDGGSSDGSFEYLNTQKDFIDFYLSEKDTGIYNAMNKGIRKAKGLYVLFLNSGDHFFNKDVLKSGNTYLKGKDLVCFNIQTVKKNIKEIVKPPKTIHSSHLFEYSLPHPSTFIKKDLFHKIGLYDESLKIVSDWKFFLLALLKYDCSYLKVDEILSTFYFDGISSLVDNVEERNMVIQENFPRYSKDIKLLIELKKISLTNRFNMLLEIEKSNFGRKYVSLFFRLFIFIFSRKKIKDITKK